MSQLRNDVKTDFATVWWSGRRPLSSESCGGRGSGRHRDRPLCRVDGSGWDGDESVDGIWVDSPVVVVDEHVMVPAEQDAVADVGGSVVVPRNPMVCLTPGGGAFAVREAA